MGRGTLRIYLGAAPGVGKTFAMLNEGRRRRARGEDVVVGFVEPHGRVKTAEQVGDLEVVPRARIEYRDAVFEEMDLDAVLARRPETALVDELAHTNVPGSRNQKRWQDVEELLDAGINVISNLNIQHLESLNDVVGQITGVVQRETIPDAVVRRADQLQLVDLAVETVRARLSRGDIYPAERIDAAMGNFFRPGNLSALRELALLWIADRVEAELEEYRARHGISKPWETRERVLVALAGFPDGDRLVRRAARMAQRLNADLIAVHVRPESGLTGPSAELLEQQRRLVDLLGGTYREFAGSDPGRTLVEAARLLNVTRILLGATRESRWHEFLYGSVIRTVIRECGTGLDVHVIGRDPELEEEQSPRKRVRPPRALPARRVLFGMALAVVGTPLLTWILVQLRENVSLSGVLLLYLLLVICVAALGGIWPALVAAVAGFLLANWYLTPPIHTFTVGTPENILALAVFLVVAIIVSSFVALAARRSAQATRARAKAETLLRLAGTSSPEAILDSLRRAFALEGTALLHRRGEHWHVEAASGSAPATPADAGFTMDVDAHHVLVGSPAIAQADEEASVLDAFARELAASVQREGLEAEAAAAEDLVAANQLGRSILSSVSHDVRTPLAAIKASVTSLLQEDVDWSEEDRRELLTTINEETDRMERLLTSMLDMSRLQAGALEFHNEAIVVEDALVNSVRALGPGASLVHFDVPEHLPPARGDEVLLERAFANIIANAVAYSDDPVRVTAGAVDSGIDIRVADRGPGVPPQERDQIFLPFRRLGDTKRREGLGLGLAVAKGFVEAMGGTIEADDTPGGGLTIVVRLRAEA